MTQQEELEAARTERLHKWAPYELAVSIVEHPDQLADTIRGAQGSADVFGRPIRIIRRYDATSDIIEPSERKLKAYGHWHNVPQWVRKEMGWTG